MHGLVRNRLLRALPAIVLEHLLPQMQSVTLSSGQIVQEPGERIEYCYFPTSSILSQLHTMQNGATAEMGMTGSEGVLGIAALLGEEIANSTALAPIAGETYRISAKLLRKEFAQSEVLQSLLLRYTYTLMAQISQTAVCNRLHSMEQRLCRWLLFCQNRRNHCELRVAQDLIAQLLGGRRESVTIAAGSLQHAGLIHYSRGHITILDRDGLELRVCECYRAVEEEYDRLLGDKKSLHAAGF